jgi:hypothetical protein
MLRPDTNTCQARNPEARRRRSFASTLGTGRKMRFAVELKSFTRARLPPNIWRRAQFVSIRPTSIYTLIRTCSGSANSNRGTTLLHRRCVIPGAGKTQATYLIHTGLGHPDRKIAKKPLRELARVDPTRDFPTPPDVVTGVTVWKVFQIILMLRFGLPKGAGQSHFRHHLARPKP